MSKDEKQMKVEITQDKLVDLLLRAATREDIAILRKETKDDLHSFKLEIKEYMNSHKQEMKSEINTLETRVNTQFKWVLGTIIGVGVPIIS